MGFKTQKGLNSSFYTLLFSTLSKLYWPFQGTYYIGTPFHKDWTKVLFPIQFPIGGILGPS